jgi:2',3'-cyclic-nucleotide 2'-phosphodiesterase (5'-nucleotidase family)
MDFLGVLDLEFEKNEENKIESKKIFNLIPTSEVKNDPKIYKIIQN